jgi:hypothetical protein
MANELTSIGGIRRMANELTSIGGVRLLSSERTSATRECVVPAEFLARHL